MCVVVDEVIRLYPGHTQGGCSLRRYGVVRNSSRSYICHERTFNFFNVHRTHMIYTKLEYMVRSLWHRKYGRFSNRARNCRSCTRAIGAKSTTRAVCSFNKQKTYTKIMAVTLWFESPGPHQWRPPSSSRACSQPRTGRAVWLVVESKLEACCQCRAGINTKATACIYHTVQHCLNVPNGRSWIHRKQTGHSA